MQYLSWEVLAAGVILAVVAWIFVKNFKANLVADLLGWILRLFH